jgi:hypothetical protein
MTEINNASIRLKYTNTFVAATPVSIEAILWALVIILTKISERFWLSHCVCFKPIRILWNCGIMTNTWDRIHMSEDLDALQTAEPLCSAWQKSPHPHHTFYLEIDAWIKADDHCYLKVRRNKEASLVPFFYNYQCLLCHQEVYSLLRLRRAGRGRSS